MHSSFLYICKTEVILFDLIIFDLDGTLVDTLPEVHQSINETLYKMGLPTVSLSTSKKAIGPGPVEFIKILLPKNSLHRSLEFTALLSETYKKYNGLFADFFPGIPELLTSLKGKVRLAIATNKSLTETMPLAEKLHFSRWFDAIFTRDEVKEPKPSPDLLLHACNTFRLPPYRALMIGDTDNDVLASRAAGMPCCLAKWGYASNQEVLAKLCTFSSDSPRDLLRILNELPQLPVIEHYPAKNC